MDATTLDSAVRNALIVIGFPRTRSTPAGFWSAASIINPKPVSMTTGTFGFFGIDRGGDLITAHTWHGAIHQHEVKPTIAEFLQTVVSTVGSLHNVSVNPQIFANDHAHHGFIINYKYVQILDGVY